MMIDALNPSQNNLADQTADVADQAIRSTQRAANHALDGLAGSVQDLRLQASPRLDRATDHARELAQRGVDAVRQRSQRLRDQAHRASDGTLNYIRQEPVKSVLLAAAVGAAVMAFMGARHGASARR